MVVERIDLSLGNGTSHKSCHLPPNKGSTPIVAPCLFSRLGCDWRPTDCSRGCRPIELHGVGRTQQLGRSERCGSRRLGESTWRVEVAVRNGGESSWEKLWRLSFIPFPLIPYYMSGGRSGFDDPLPGWRGRSLYGRRWGTIMQRFSLSVYSKNFGGTHLSQNLRAPSLQRRRLQVLGMFWVLSGYTSCSFDTSGVGSEEPLAQLAGALIRWPADVSTSKDDSAQRRISNSRWGSSKSAFLSRLLDGSRFPKGLERRRKRRKRHAWPSS